MLISERRFPAASDAAPALSAPHEARGTLAVLRLRRAARPAMGSTVPIQPVLAPVQA